MEPLLILLGLALLAGMFLGPIFGFIAWLTSRENRRQLELLKRPSSELQQLQRKVLALERRLAAGAEPVPVEASAEASVVSAADERLKEEFPEEDPLVLARAKESVKERATALPMMSKPEPLEPEPLEPEPLEPKPRDAIPAPPSQRPPVESPAPPPQRPPAEPPPLDSSEPPGGDGDSGIDWEQWVGLRGAAVLGGIVMALAALLFLKYSVENDLIPPVLRVALAVFAGLGAIGGSQMLRKRGYETTANALAGAGVVILYAAVWAARVLYGLIGVGVAYLLMVLVTLVCGLLSWRYRSLVVAMLGLVGGFATPALLSSGSNNPIGLFSYILLLNLGLLTLARRRGWPILALVSLVMTGLYQAGWILTRMSADEGLIALAVLGVFAVLFAVATARVPMDPEAKAGGLALPSWLGGGGAVSLAFALSLHLSGQTQMEGKLWPLVGLLVLLSLATHWMGRVHNVPWLPLAAAGAVVATFFNWLRRNDGGEGGEWQVVGAALALALAFHLFLEWERRWGNREDGDSPPSWAPSLAAFGLLLVLVIPALGGSLSALLPWVCSWLALAALLVRQSMMAGLEPAQALGALGLGLGSFSLLANGGRSQLVGGLPSPWIFLGGVVAACVGFQALGLRRSGWGGLWADAGAALLPLLVLVGFASTPDLAYRGPSVFLGGSLLLALLMVLAVTRQRSGLGYAGVVATLALVHLSWAEVPSRLALDRPHRLLAIGLEASAVILLTFWPVLAGRAFAKKRWAWYGAALAGPAWFFPLGGLYEDTFGDGALGILPLALGALSLFAAFRTRKLWSSEEPLRKTSLVWFAAIALGFVSLAIPLQLEKEWITVGWALQGLATLGLWKRLDHPGLKYFSLALLGTVALRLLVNPAVLGYHQTSGVPVLNWLSYTYLVPAACLLGGAYLLQSREVERQRPWEEALYFKGNSVTAGICGLTAILVVFAWINLSIADYFSVGSELTLSFERAAARDLTTSLAWGVFALTLLAIGIAKGWAVLRWISLGFLVLTIGKVFLYDLGELEDLYRVASLVGLAISLILVSLVYQRFVFRRQPPD